MTANYAPPQHYRYASDQVVEKAGPLTSEQITRFRDELSALPQFEPETEHYFIPAEGGGYLYCRKVSRPANVVTLGRVHKKEHFYIVAKGKIGLRGEYETTIYEAGSVIPTKPGAQRFVVSIEDSVTITMHKVSTNDLEEAERELVEDDENSNYGVGNKVKPGLLKQSQHERIES